MSFLENEYKKRFANKHLSDDKIDAEDLWAAIEKGLEVPATKPTGYWDWLKKYRFAFALLLLLLSVVGILQWTKPIEEKPLAETNPVIQKTNKNNLSNTYQKQSENTPSVFQDKNLDKTSSTNKTDNRLSDSYQNQTTNTPSVFQGKNSDKANLQNNGEHNLSNNYANQTKSTPSVFQHESLDKISLQSNTADKISNNYPQNTPSVNSDKNTDLVTQNSLLKADKTDVLSKNTNLPVAEVSDNPTQTAENSHSNQSLVKKEAALNTMGDLSFLPAKISLLTLDKLLFETLDMPIAANKKKKRKTFDWQLGISTGVNTLAINYASDSSAAIAALKNEAEKGQLGWNSSVHFTLLRNDKWRFSTGLTYAQYSSKLDYRQEKMIKVLKTNQLLQVWINKQTGDTLRTRRGDTTVNALSVREVVHHNSFQQLSIPLTIGIQNRVGNWIYGINAGTVLNFTTQQAGKTIDNSGELQLFSNGDVLSPLPKTSLGLQISPLVGYSITRNWSINCQPQWSWQFKNNSNTTHLKSHVHQFGLNLQSVWQF
jgi:hypothetical protein